MQNKNKKTQKEEPEDDIVFEEEAKVAFGTSPDAFEGAFRGEELTDSLKKLKEKLKACTKEKQEYLDGWQRAKADFQNFKKEGEQDRERFKKFASEGVIHDIIPVLDSFDMAFANKEAWEKVDSSWRSGVEYICSQLKNILLQHGVVEIDPSGQKFDPQKHASTEIITTSKEKEDDIVAEVVQKGYTLHDKTIRPARVKVFQYEK